MTHFSRNEGRQVWGCTAYACSCCSDAIASCVCAMDRPGERNNFGCRSVSHRWYELATFRSAPARSCRQRVRSGRLRRRAQHARLPARF